MFKRKQFTNPTLTEAIHIAERFCAYQERYTTEILQFLKDSGVETQHFDDILVALQENNFFNEARYCRQFAGGKFRVKGWGRIKIRAALRQKGLSNKLIEAALLSEIEPEDYAARFQLLHAQYIALFPETDRAQRFRYFLQKGYETEIIYTYI